MRGAHGGLDGLRRNRAERGNLFRHLHHPRRHLGVIDDFFDQADDAAPFRHRPGRRSATAASPVRRRSGAAASATRRRRQASRASLPGRRSWRCGRQIRISAAIAISMPPPSTQPFSAAITGFLISRTNAAYSMRSRNAMTSDRSASVLRSLPAEKARSPAPPMVTTRISRFVVDSAADALQFARHLRRDRIHLVGTIEQDLSDAVLQW